jgi:lipopolysaccharide export system permease protein
MRKRRARPATPICGPMRLIQRYLHRQILGPTIAATVILGTVALLSQSLSALDVIVDQRQSLGVFLYLTLLALPQLLSIILPVALFVAAILSLNRLHTDQEIVVCFAGGMSRWNVIAPAMRLAAATALLALIVNLWVQPPAARAFREEIFRVRADLAASLVRPGEFTEAASGLTVYAQEATPEGRLKNIFIHQQSAAGSTTFNAREGQITKRDGKPVLMMRRGSSQQLSQKGVLNFLSFDDYTLDLSPYLSTSNTIQYKASDRFLHELFFPDTTLAWERENYGKLLAEGHARLATPIYNLSLVAIALAAVIGGAFSRLGYGRRIIMAAAAAALIRLAGFGAQALATSVPWLNILQYLVPLAAVAVPMWLLFRQKVSRHIPNRALGMGLSAAGVR